MAEYNWVVIVLSIIVLIGIGYFIYNLIVKPSSSINTNSTNYTNASAYYQIRTSNGYQIIYPNTNLTPGEIYTDDLNLICNHYYDILLIDDTIEFENQVYVLYNITNPGRKDYEIDHWIPVALGGSNNISNRWAEPVGYPGYKEKDAVQRYLRERVCQNNMTLTEARQLVTGDWFSIYLNITQND